MDLFSLVGRISLDKTGFDSGIREANRQGENLGRKMQKWLGTSAKVLTGTMAAASAGMTKLVRDSLSAYASFEQLKDGVKTIFGDDAAKVLKNAQTAYRDAGVSMNQYMELTMEGSAALIKSLRGDTALAAQYSDMSIKDMSDNVNKMGTSIEAVQNAYRGFSRGNFTMLDNLKLGYAGTKQGMKDLLKDAEAIQKKHGKTVKYSIDSYADIIDAIHVIQEEMGITGTTEKEAAETIEGSMKMAKASFQDFLVALATGNKTDVTRATENMVSSFRTAAENIGKRLGYIATGLSEAMQQLAPIIRRELPDVVKKILPGIISSAGSLVSGLIAALPGVLQALKETLPGALMDVANATIDAVNELLGTNIPHISEIRWPTWDEVREGLSKAWELIQQGAASVLKLVFGETEDGGIKWPTGEELWGKVSETVVELWKTVQGAAGEVLKLVFGTNKDGGIAWPTGKELWAKVETAFSEMWAGLSDAASGIMKLVFGENKDGSIKWPTAEELWNSVSGAFATLWEGITEAASGVMKLVFGKNEDGSIKWPTAEEIWPKVQQGLTDLWNGIMTFAGGILKIVFGATPEGGIEWPSPEKFWEGIKGGLEHVWEFVKGAAGGVLRFAFGTAEDGGIDFPKDAKELWGKISGKFGELWEGVKKLAATGLRLAFGIEDGGIDWPEPSKIGEAFRKWWDETAKPALTSAIHWFLPIFDIEEGDDAHTAGTKVAEKIGEWWKKVKGDAEGALGWTLGVFDLADEDGTLSVGKLKTWWTEKVVPALEGVLDFGLGAFGLDDLDTIKQKIHDAAKEIQDYIINPIAEKLAPVIKFIKDAFNTLFPDTGEANRRWEDGQAVFDKISAMFGDEKGQNADFAAYRALPERVRELYKQILDMNEQGLDTSSALQELADAYNAFMNPQAADKKDSFAGTEGSAAEAAAKVNALQQTINSLTGKDVKVGVYFDYGGGATGDGSGAEFPRASGQNYVPYDGFRASLHRGEAVLNAAQARDWRSGGGGGYGIDSAALEAAVASAVASAVGNIQINMDGESVGHAVAGTVDSDIGALADSARYT